MTNYKNLAAFHTPIIPREAESIDDKIEDSKALLAEFAGQSLMDEITSEEFVTGEVPRLSEFDLRFLPPKSRFVKLPKKLVKGLMAENSQDRMDWNMPSYFLSRLEVGKEPFKSPVPGESAVMDRFSEQGRVVSFSNLRIESPPPETDRLSRTLIHEKLSEHNIMGRGRLPFGLGSVPDVGSVLSYITIAQSNGMAFIARDKVLSDVGYQVDVARRVIDTLQTMELPAVIMPDNDDLHRFWKIMNLPEDEYSQLLAEQRYKTELRASWIDNVGAAIEASPRGIERAKRLYEAGCHMFRIYSPEGGREIINQVESLRSNFDSDTRVKIVAGQLMDSQTAGEAAKAKADAIIIGVAGGSQCTTSKNAGIPVNTPNLLYELRSNSDVNVPIGIEGGGVGDHLMAAFVLGASFVLKPGEIGMSVEGAGGRFMLKDSKSNYWMPYGGEASDSSKWWRDQLDKQGRPLFVEGEPGMRDKKH
jgi:hypothetical protein